MSGRPPTPQGISVLLRKAGFERAAWTSNDCTSAGYVAWKDEARDGTPAVRVEFVQPTAEGRDLDRRSVLLSDYARACEQAGWRADRMTGHVFVTAAERQPATRDARALDRIADLLEGDYSPGMRDEIAAIVRATGRQIGER